MKTMLLLTLGVSFALLVQAQVFSAPQTQTFSTAAGDVTITPLVHASVLIQAGNKTIYVDPVKPPNLAALPKADLILITHIHSDHFDPDSIAALRQPSTEIIAPPSVVEQFPSAKPMTNGQTLHWQQWAIEAVPAYNLTRGPAPGTLYHPRGRDNGYVFTYGGKRFYFSADTENIPEMHSLKNIDVAFMCMNLPFTMTPEEAAAAVKVIHPKIVIPYHDRGTDLNVFKRLLAGTGIEVRLLDLYPK